MSRWKSLILSTLILSLLPITVHSLEPITTITTTGDNTQEVSVKVDISHPDSIPAPLTIVVVIKYYYLGIALQSQASATIHVVRPISITRLDIEEYKRIVPNSITVMGQPATLERWWIPVNKTIIESESIRVEFKLK